MRSMLRGLVAALLLAAPLPLVAQNPTTPAPQPHPRMDRGPGMMGHDMGPGMMGPGMMGARMGRGPFMGPGMHGAMLEADPAERLLNMKNRLGLSADQVSKLQAIQSRFKDQNEDLLQKLRQDHEQMQAQMQKQRQDLLGGKSWQDLTPEQRQDLRQKMEQQGAAMRDQLMKHEDEMMPLVQKLRAARQSEMGDVRGVLTYPQQDHLRLIMMERMRSFRGMARGRGWMREGGQRGRMMAPGQGPAGHGPARMRQPDGPGGPGAPAAMPPTPPAAPTPHGPGL